MNRKWVACVDHPAYKTWKKKKSLLWKGSSSNSPLRVTTVQKYPGSARSRGLHVLLLDHGNMGRSCRCTSNRKRFSRKHMGDMDTGLLSSDVHPSRWTHKWRQPGIFRAGKKRGKQLGHQAISKYTNMTIRTNIPAPAPSSPDRQVCALCYRSSLFHLDAGLHAALHVKEPTLHGGPGWRYCLHLHSRREKMADALISGGWRHTTGLCWHFPSRWNAFYRRGGVKAFWLTKGYSDGHRPHKEELAQPTLLLACMTGRKMPLNCADAPWVVRRRWRRVTIGVQPRRDSKSPVHY